MSWVGLFIFFSSFLFFLHLDTVSQQPSHVCGNRKASAVQSTWQSASSDQSLIPPARRGVQSLSLFAVAASQNAIQRDAAQDKKNDYLAHLVRPGRQGRAGCFAFSIPLMAVLLERKSIVFIFQPSGLPPSSLRIRGLFLNLCVID